MNPTATLIGIALWSLIPGFIAKHKGRSFLAYYFLGWVITPLISMIITLVISNLNKEDSSRVPGYKPEFYTATDSIPQSVLQSAAPSPITNLSEITAGIPIPSDEMGKVKCPICDREQDTGRTKCRSCGCLFMTEEEYAEFLQKKDEEIRAESIQAVTVVDLPADENITDYNEVESEKISSVELCADTAGVLEQTSLPPTEETVLRVQALADIPEENEIVTLEVEDSTREAQAEKIEFCRFCGYKLVEESRFCSRCGKPTEIPKKCCLKCGQELPDSVIFCHKCGTKV